MLKYFLIANLHSKLFKASSVFPMSKTIFFFKQKTSVESRIGIIHNPKSSGASSNLIRKSIQVALEVLDRHTAKLFIVKLLKPSNVQQVLSGEKTVLDFAISVSVYLGALLRL